MPDNHEDTRPRRPVAPTPHSVPKVRPADGTATAAPTVYMQPNEVPAPPRLLFWAVIGVFVLGVVGVIGSVAAFRFVLEPAQQQRVMDVLPFMEAFMPPRPAPDAKLPTPAGLENENVSADDLLNDLLGDSATATPTAEAIATETPTATPTSEPPTATPTLEATATTEPTAQPTQEAAAPNTDTTTATDTTAANIAATAEPTQSPQSALPPIPSSARLNGFIHQQQTWNNCGPANITMALSYYGWQNDQTYAMRFLRPGGREDKNVSPSELVDFVNTQTAVRALTRMGGTIDLLKRLIANEFPVVIETGFMPEGYEWLGHYRTLVAYDTDRGVFWIYDSFLGTGENGEGIAETFTQLDRNWQEFNRQFIVIYEPQREELVRRILGDYADPQKAAEIAQQTARTEANADQTNEYAWFNLGSSLVALGDYELAFNAYTLAMREGLPWRIVFYQFGIYEAFYETGRYQELLSLVDSSLANGGNYVEEVYYWQGKALSALGRGGEARTAFNQALQRNPSFRVARDALEALN